MRAVPATYRGLGVTAGAMYCYMSLLSRIVWWTETRTRPAGATNGPRGKVQCCIRTSAYTNLEVPHVRCTLI